MRKYKPPNRLGRPPNCRWFSGYPPEPPDLWYLTTFTDSSSSPNNFGRNNFYTNRTKSLVLCYSVLSEKVFKQQTHLFPIPNSPRLFWLNPIYIMRKYKPPNRLGLPPNCRWISMRPRDLHKFFLHETTKLVGSPLFKPFSGKHGSTLTPQPQTKT